MGTLKLGDHLSKFLPLGKLTSSLLLLLKPTDLALVHRMLDEQNNGPLPGLDGVSTKVHKALNCFRTCDTPNLGGGGGALG